MPLRYDLHTHSTMSDGALSPAKLVEYAVKQQIDILALTDHDTTEGVAEASLAARNRQITIVPGVEISVTWSSCTIHILGLNVDHKNRQLQQGLAALRTFRNWRAKEIGRRLEKAGIAGSYSAAREYAGGASSIGRVHFARFLVAQGLAANVPAVFKRFLAKGKPGHVSGKWASLEQALAWIHGAGGQAVIAHPARYRLNATRLRRLIGEFNECGGEGLEVVSSSHSRKECVAMAMHARRSALLASCGSDYHGPGNPWAELGKIPPFPTGCTPIWKSPRWRLYDSAQEGYPLQSGSERWPRG